MILAIFCASLTLHITNASGALDPDCCEPWAEWTHWTEVTPCRQGSSQTSLGLLGFMFKEEKCCLSNKNKNCQRHVSAFGRILCGWDCIATGFNKRKFSYLPWLGRKKNPTNKKHVFSALKRKEKSSCHHTTSVLVEVREENKVPGITQVLAV